MGRSDQVLNPGDYFTGVFMGWPYVITRTDSGTLKAFFNVCSHHGTCVAQGSGQSTQFVCPYHGWTYDLNGTLKRAPRAGAIAELRTRNLDLKEIPVTEWGPLIALHGTPKQSLDDTLSALWGTFLRIRLQTCTLCAGTVRHPCNWKVFVDNYLDGATTSRTCIPGCLKPRFLYNHAW